MAKFTSNHSRASQGNNTGKFIRIVLGLGLILVFSAALWLRKEEAPAEERSVEYDPEILADYLPAGGSGEIIQHAFFTISYNEEHEQADWVAYELTREQLKRQRVERSRYFYADSLVQGGTAEWYDYRGSKYSRGHLVPAADRGWDADIMQSTFLMSNISPQLEQFNGGIWREAEETIRDWAMDKGHLYVVSGPVLDDCALETIGQENRITVPCHFFKAVLYLNDEREGRSLGFIFPHKVSDRPISEFMVTIDSLEKYLAWDFFPGVAVNEEQHEGLLDQEFWPVSPEKYQMRINQWNKKKR